MKDIPEGKTADDVVMEGLIAKANGDPYDEDLVAAASLAVVARFFMRQGMSEDQATDLALNTFEKGGVRITFSEVEGLVITVGDIDS